MRSRNKFAATGKDGISVCCAGGARNRCAGVFGVHDGSDHDMYQDSRRFFYGIPAIYLNDLAGPVHSYHSRIGRISILRS